MKPLFLFVLVLGISTFAQAIQLYDNQQVLIVLLSSPELATTLSLEDGGVGELQQVHINRVGTAPNYKYYVTLNYLKDIGASKLIRCTVDAEMAATIRHHRPTTTELTILTTSVPACQ